MSVTLWQSHVARGKMCIPQSVSQSPLMIVLVASMLNGSEGLVWKQASYSLNLHLIKHVGKTFYLEGALAFRLESHYFKLSYASASS